MSRSALRDCTGRHRTWRGSHDPPDGPGATRSLGLPAVVCLAARPGRAACPRVRPGETGHLPGHAAAPTGEAANASVLAAGREHLSADVTATQGVRGAPRRSVRTLPTGQRVALESTRHLQPDQWSRSGVRVVVRRGHLVARRLSASSSAAERSPRGSRRPCRSARRTVSYTVVCGTHKGAPAGTTGPGRSRRCPSRLAARARSCPASPMTGAGSGGRSPGHSLRAGARR